MAIFSLKPPAGSLDAAIRPVRPGDAPRVRRVLQVAFEDENRRMGMRETRLPTMTDELLAYYLEQGAGASLVAEARGGLLGFCLAHRWGDVAWLGPIAVLPPAQTQGLGKRLVEASLQILRKQGVVTLGLETMPRSYRNLQFYTSIGMRLCGLTMDLSRLLGDVPGSVSGRGDVRLVRFSGLGGDEREEALTLIGRLSHEAARGLDHREDVEGVVRHGLGDGLLIFDGERPAGFAVVHEVPYAREEQPGTARLNTLVLVPEAPSAPEAVAELCERFMAAFEGWVGASGHDAMILRVPGRQDEMLRCLLARGYRITHSDVRLTCADLPEHEDPGTVHLSKWE